MEKKIKYPIILLVAIVSFSFLVYFVYFDFNPKNPDTNPNYDKIPFGYYQDLDMANYYIYNITDFGNSSVWNPFPKETGDNETLWSTNSGGQIRIKFSGFFEPSEELNKYNLLDEKKIPHIDIQILKNKSSSLILNETVTNTSNIQGSKNLNIGFNTFRAGFLIPYTNISYIKNLVYNANATNSNCSGIVNIEETYNFIFIGFTQTNAENPNANLTSLMTYDKHTGLLVRFYSQLDDFMLDMSLINYSFDFNHEFQYKVLEFESNLNLTNWYSNFSYGLFKSNPNGRIDIQFIDYYEKNVNDSSVFQRPIPHLDISFVENKSGMGYEDYEIGLLRTNGSLSNFSSTELAHSMNVGYRDFNSGFLLPTTNISEIIVFVNKQNQSGEWEAEIEIIETNLSIHLDFKKVDQTKNISLIYDKHTGLLQYVCVNSTVNPNIELNISYYNPLISLKNLTLIIVHQSSDTDIWANFSLYIGEETVYDALIKWCEVSFDDYGLMGYLITGIDGDNGDWRYSINDQYVGVAANKAKLNNNDIIKWWRGGY
ncbi:MAG: DUF4430 domain-containing protein [Candidatus Lokiarchaeota archaeon]|nr:DUF4430 domain-containing protein [Candidatus Lokiarchaeota archaeon]